MEVTATWNSISGALKAPDSTPNSGDIVMRPEIDTSAPFESVKEAVDRFGGSAVWKTQLKQLVCSDNKLRSEDDGIVEMEEQAAQLQKALMLKERETLDVLKELEKTKKIADDLKLRLEQATSEVIVPTVEISSVDLCATDEVENSAGICCLEGPCERNDNCPGQILIELKLAKENLNRRTDLTGIQSTIKLLNSKIKEEKHRLEQAQQNLAYNISLISSLKDDLDKTTEKLQLVKDEQQRKCEDPSSILQEIKQRNVQIDQYKKLAESAKADVAKLTLEIEQTKASTKTAEIQLLAARKIEEAANAAKDAALAEIKALTSSDNSNFDAEGIAGVALTKEEYATLTNVAQKADEKSKQKIELAVRQIDEANKSKSEILLKVEEATQEVKVFTKALENALMRVEAANQGKLAVEDALRKWRSEHGQKRRNVHNVTKFKTTAHQQKKECHVIDLDDSTLMTELPSNGFRPPLSIGQILSMKLSSPESMEYNVGVPEKENEKPKFSLGQVLNKKQVVSTPQRHNTEDGSNGKHFTAKRKKIGIVGFSLLLAKHNKKNKKKRESLTSR